jgi:tetratricopeptide (TPR) repeat protein
VWAAAARRLGPAAAAARFAPSVAIAAGALLSLQFALHAQGRAGLWRHRDLLTRDAIQQYPNGATALFTTGVVFAQQGNPDRAVEFLRAAADRGHHFMQPFRIRRLESLEDDPRFQELLRDIAARRIAYARERGYTSQQQLSIVANSHYVRGELDEAIEVLDQAIRTGGPLRSQLIDELMRIRREQSERRGESNE